MTTEKLIESKTVVENLKSVSEEFKSNLLVACDELIEVNDYLISAHTTLDNVEKIIDELTEEDLKIVSNLKEAIEGIEPTHNESVDHYFNLLFRVCLNETISA